MRNVSLMILITVIVSSTVLKTSAANIFQPGNQLNYKLESSVLINDIENSKYGIKDVGHKITGDLQLSTIWQNPNNELEKLLQIKFQTKSVQTKETDICGHCLVSYIAIDDKTLRKNRRNCTSSHLISRQHPEKMLSVDVSSHLDTVYQFDNHTDNYFKRITAYDRRIVKLNVDYNVGSVVTSILDLNFNDMNKDSNLSILKSSSFKMAIKNAESEFKCKLLPRTLLIEDKSSANLLTNNSAKFLAVIKEHRNNLNESKLGTMKSAESFLEVLKIARLASKEEILKTIKSIKNKEIINQLVDILGAAQTMEAHEAFKQNFKFTDIKNLDVLERYLWALSIGCCPSEILIRDLINIWKNMQSNEKLQETLLLSITSMTRQLNLNANEFNNELPDEVFLLLSNGLSKCESSNCLAVFIRAFKNLGDARCKPILVDYALNGSRVVSVAAMKALYALSSTYWDKKVIDMAEKIFYEKLKKYDSSARTIAADILLEGTSNRKILRNLLKFLSSHYAPYEIKRYLLQRILQISSTDNQYAENVRAILISEKLNNYNTFAQRGLSNALTTTFFEYSGINATLYSVNEIFKGTTKRSIISVALERNVDDVFKLFSLGIFTGGLSSFMWSEDSSSGDELDEPEDTIAGLEMTVFGAQIRPFIFFSGHGELMGHIWSGTASERTPVFQAISLLHDHQQFIPLCDGSIINLNLLGASSLELAGQINFSLWNRNANSLVEILSGTSIRGLTTIKNSFVTSQIEFDLGSQAKLNLISNLNFYNEIALCLQLSQPDFLMKYGTNKNVYMSDTNYKFKRSKKRQISVLGRTYPLGAKNNEMCKTIFS